MTKINLAYNIVDYTPATAAPVDLNFDRIEQHINQELIERDGTVAMRAQLKLIGDPIAALDAAPKQYVDQVLPIGIIMMYGGIDLPTGGRWMVCNGAELQTAQYGDLWNKIGHNFSPAGTPDSRFNLPNLSDRLPMGVGVATTIGETGGSKDAVVIDHDHGMGNHTHTIAHDHGVTVSTTGDHRHSQFTDNNAGGNVEARARGIDKSFSGNYGGDSAGDHTHAVNILAASPGTSGAPSTNHTDNRGVAGTNLNLPPFLGVQFIIRIS